MRRVEGKVAVISGGGSGIGKACATVLALEGASVAVADIDADAARLTAAEIVDGGGTAMAGDRCARSQCMVHRNRFGGQSIRPYQHLGQQCGHRGGYRIRKRQSQRLAGSARSQPRQRYVGHSIRHSGYAQ